MRCLLELLLLAPGLVRGGDLADLIANKQWRQAAELMQSQLKANSNDASVQLHAAEIRFAQGRLAEAATHAEKAAELDARSAGAQHLLFEIYGSQAQQASILRQAGLARKCKTAVDRAIELDAKHYGALIGSMMYLYQAPGLFGGDKKQAESIPARIGAYDPAHGHLAQAELDKMRKQLGRLRESYQRAVAANPKLYNARVALARDYAFGREPELPKAIAEAREAVQLMPRRHEGWDALLYALARQGNKPGVDAALADAARRMPGEGSPLFNAARGWMEGAQPDDARAEALLRAYLKTQPDVGRPTLGMAHWSLAIALEKQGRKEDARAAIETAARLEPKNERIQNDLKRLRG